MQVLYLFITISLWAQTSGSDLKGYSEKLNKELPEIFDHATKLMKTSVENDNLYYHFILRATKEEYAQALPKVQNQTLKTVCSQKREAPVLKVYKANLIYRYENEKGQSLGEFMIRPSHCPN